MIFRQVNERISFDNHLGHYFFNWCGDELLLKATNDADAIAEAEALEAELNTCD
jgi:hypothetical protein